MKITAIINGFRWDQDTVYVAVTLPDGTMTAANFTFAPWHAQKMKKDIFVGGPLEIDDPNFSSSPDHIQVRGKLISIERGDNPDEWRVVIESKGVKEHLSGTFLGLNDGYPDMIGKNVVLNLRRGQS
jgi:hypothetical protein